MPLTDRAQSFCCLHWFTRSASTNPSCYWRMLIEVLAFLFASSYCSSTASYFTISSKFTAGICYTIPLPSLIHLDAVPCTTLCKPVRIWKGILAAAFLSFRCVSKSVSCIEASRLPNDSWFALFKWTLKCLWTVIYRSEISANLLLSSPKWFS